ncbi:MAG: VOC family protein [Candidatus Binatia bacterium]
MPATLDHLLWASRDLDAAVDALDERSGVRAVFGGHHPELGTHNALARLGPRVFLEVIAPDPKLPSGTLARQLATLTEPVLLMWAARTNSAAATAARAEAEGYRATVVQGRRPRPDDEVVRWTNVFLSGHGGGTMVPFFIEWHEDTHPADTAATGLELASFIIETPQPESLRSVLAALDVKVAVHRGDRDRLVAAIDTPRGRIELTGPDPPGRRTR